MRTEIRLFRRGNRLVHAPAPMRWSLTSTMRSSLILNEIQNRSRTICHYGVGDVIGVVKRFRDSSLSVGLNSLELKLCCGSIEKMLEKLKEKQIILIPEEDTANSKLDS